MAAQPTVAMDATSAHASVGGALIRNPHDRWLWPSIAAASIAALAAGGLFYSWAAGTRPMDFLPETTRMELASLSVKPIRTLVLEREWVANGFDPVLLIAPVGPMPCEGAVQLLPSPQQAAARDAFRDIRTADRDRAIRLLTARATSHPDNPLIALMLATSLIRAHRYEEAEIVAKRVLPDTLAPLNRNLSDFDLSLLTQLHHAYGVARLKNRRREPPWPSLQSALGAAGSISRHGLRGNKKDVPWNVRIVPIGCPPATAGPSLSFADLLNNLVVAYMSGSYHHADRSDLASPPPESSDAVAVKRLLATQYERERSNGWIHESQLFALAMVVLVLEQGVPDDARLAVNSIQVLEWWTTAERCPTCSAELLADLHDVRDSLLEKAFAGRNIELSQREEFARTVTRMLADSTFDRSKVADEDVQAIWVSLPADQRSKLDYLLATADARSEFLHWISAAESSAPPRDRFGPYTQQWQSAVAYDFASSAAPLVAKWPAAEQRQSLASFHRLIGDGEIPPALQVLEHNRPWMDRLYIRLYSWRPLWIVSAITFATTLWLAIVWVLVQAWEGLTLRTSLYNVELEYFSRRPRDRS
jgi:hypothetical protein